MKPRERISEKQIFNRLLQYLRKVKMTYKCALCADSISKNVYYCTNHEWHLCWNCVRKAMFTNELTCKKCGKRVRRVD